jgi:hypothetical protein
MKKLLYTIIFGILFLSSSVWGADPYWASTTGTKSWTGDDCQNATKLTGTNACSMATVNSSAVAGNRVVFNDGDYYTSLNPSSSGSSLVIDVGAITFQSLYEWSSGADGVQYGPKLENNSYGIDLRGGEDYLIIDGFGREETSQNSGLNADGSDYVVWKNSYFRVNGITSYTFISIDGSSNFWELDNIVLDVIDDGTADGEIIQFGDYADNGGPYYVHDSTFIDGQGHGIFEATMTSDLVIYNNTFYTTGAQDNCTTGYCYFISGVINLNMIIENNTFYEGAADRLDETRHGLHFAISTKAKIRGNTFSHIDGKTFGPWVAESETWKGRVIEHNVFYHNTLYKTLQDSWPGTGSKIGTFVLSSSVDGAPGAITYNKIANNIIQDVNEHRSGKDYVHQLTELGDYGNILYNEFFGNWLYQIEPSDDIGRYLELTYNDAPLMTGCPTCAESLWPTEYYNNTDGTDPKLIDPENLDFGLESDSGAIDAAEPLTYTDGVAGGGSSDQLIVDDPYFFQALDFSWALGTWAKDTIYVKGDGSPADFSVQISSIDYGTRTLTLASSQNWEDGASIYWCPQGECFRGSAPDIGALERGEVISAPYPTAQQPCDNGSSTDAVGVTSSANANCKYSEKGVDTCASGYAALDSQFTTGEGTTSHSFNSTVNCDASKTYVVICQDTATSEDTNCLEVVHDVAVGGAIPPQAGINPTATSQSTITPSATSQSFVDPN